jgi:hypothetical protein
MWAKGRDHFFANFLTAAYKSESRRALIHWVDKDKPAVRAISIWQARPRRRARRARRRARRGRAAGRAAGRPRLMSPRTPAARPPPPPPIPRPPRCPAPRGAPDPRGRQGLDRLPRPQGGHGRHRAVCQAGGHHPRVCRARGPQHLAATVFLLPSVAPSALGFLCPLGLLRPACLCRMRPTMDVGNSFSRGLWCLVLPPCETLWPLSPGAADARCGARSRGAA